MDRVTEVFHRRLAPPQYDGRAVVWWCSAGFRVYTHEVEFPPHDVDELVDVEPFSGRYGDAVRDLVEEVELLY